MTASDSTTYIPLSGVIGSGLWPEDTVSAGGALEKLAYEDIEVYTNDVSVEVHINARVVDEVVLALPFLDSVGLVLGGDPATGSGAVALRLIVDWSEDNPGSTLYIEADVLRIRFARDLLIPATKNEDGKFIPDENPDHFVEIGLPLALLVKSGGEIEFVSAETSPGFSLTPCFVGDSGCVIEADHVIFAFSEGAVDRLPASIPRSGRGLYLGTAALHLPEGLSVALPNDIVLEHFFVGSGGFSGKATGNWNPTLKADKTGFEGNGAGELFGIPFGLETLSLEFRQNTFVASSLGGKLLLPFFDGEVDVDIGINLGGGFSVALSSPDGLFTLTKTNVAEIELDSLSFEIEGGVFTTKLSGKLTPLFGNNKGLKWPAFDVRDLTIDSKGNVKLPGGWLSLAQQKTFDFHGFKIEISQIGFGKNDDGSKWIGFSGGLKLVEGLQAGASVEGLRITWRPGEQPNISLNGVKVEFAVPGVLHLTGGVSYREITDEEGNLIRRFDGDIDLTIETPEIRITGMMVIGSVKGEQGRYNFFAIYGDVELPTGIPLANTGLGIYGFAGLLALQMEPNKKPEEMWFSIDHGKSFYHRNKPGITDLKNKWDPRKGSFALGAGITLGTLSDNGYTFNGKFLLAIVIPGPIVLIQGAASFLKKRADKQSEGQFRALTVIDGRAGSILIGLDAEYKTGKGGELIDIGGSMEAFYAFHDPTAWHLWLGKDQPNSLRIRALFARLVEANAYFMLDARQLALGAWFGYNNGWNFGPLSVRLEAWADGNALISFKPTHFRGDLWLHCLIELKVFKFGLGLALDARITANLFKPYHLRGEFSVGIKVFRKKIGATVVLEWKRQQEGPPLPLPVAEVAVEHLKSTVVWPLNRGRYLLPSYDDGGGFLAPPGPHPQLDLSKLPRVPVDGRISVTFGRSVHDVGMVGSNVQPVDPPKERIGNPGGPAVVEAKYSLARTALERWDGQGWQTVAASPKTGSPPSLYGTWVPAPQLPAGSANPPKPAQTKLLLWSKNPFDFIRRTGSSWEEWVTDGMPDYPCIPPLPAQEICVDFANLAPGTVIQSPWIHPGPPVFTLSWGFGPATVQERLVPVPGDVRKVKTLCFPVAAARKGVQIHSDQPGRSFRIVLAQGEVAQPVPTASGVAVAPVFTTIDDVPVCIDFRRGTVGTQVNPWVEEGVRFEVRGAEGGLLPVARVERWGAGLPGLGAGFRLDIALPCPSPWVELVVTHRPPFRIVAFDAKGMAVATHAPGGTGGEVTETIRLEGPAITRVEVHAAGNEKLIHRVCYTCPRPEGPWATGVGADGEIFGPFFPVGGSIEIPGKDMTGTGVTNDGPLCLERICVTPDPETGQEVRGKEAIEHIREELARWRQEGAVLAPHTTYRLVIETSVEPQALVSLDNFPPSGLDLTPVEYAYFRTSGPPGLGVLDPPEGLSPSTVFSTGLDDLTRYVRETTPPTVPPPGEKPILFKPFYRAYDIGVEFNEDYVETMYRMDRRDLGLYLYDNNNQPARDAEGRLLVLGNRWGKAETLSLSERDTRWVTLIDAATCLPEKLDPKTFPRDSTLVSSEPGRVLAADTLYEPRLVPMLLHESFSGSSLGAVPPGWYREDSGPGGPSDWKVGEAGEPPSRFVEQLSTIGGAGPERPGTLLLLAESSTWTDYRVSVYVRSAAGGAVGVVVRRQGPDTGYRFSLDGRVRRLVKGDASLLGEDHFAYRRNRDYLVTFEALGSSLKVYLDGEPVFEVTDADFKTGRIGLYVCQSPGARFSDVRVDDFRAEAPVVYRFQLTTSLFANFFHHLHSFQDETWRAVPDANPGDLLKEAVELSLLPPEEKEARAYEALAKSALQSAALQNPRQVEVTRLEWESQAVAFLLRSPEPLAWDRVSMAFFIGPVRDLPAEPPGAVKLVEASFGTLPGDESVTLLLREAVDLSRWRIELRLPSGPLPEPEGDPVMLLERFQSDPKTVLDRFTVADLGTEGGPSDWRVEGGTLIQVSEIRGGAEPELPGTVAVTGDAGWTDYRLTVDLRSDSGSGLGIVFRWVDGDNHYRLSLDAGLKYRRLIKREKGVVSILWEEEKGYAAGETFRLTVEAVGSRLTGFLGSDRLFEITDSAHAAGRVGLYASGNPDARFESVEVRRPSLDVYTLVRDRFAAGDLTGWLRTDEAAAPQPSTLEAVGGALILRSFVQEEDGGTFPGSYAFIGPPFKDAVCSARLLCHFGEAIGMVVRGQDLGNYYRFSMDAQRGYRRLVKKVKGQTTVLWEDGVAYTPGQVYELTVAAVGTSLRGYLDGAPLFSVEDGDVPAGVIALYAWNNPEALFSQVRVFPPDRAGEPSPEPRWTTWYAFGGEERLPAGTRLRISAGPEAGAPPAEPGTERRFAAPLGETGRPRFPAAGAELRVVGPEGPGHTRTLLPYSDYVILPPPRVLRRADGTGLVVVPSDGSPLGEARYQLSFTYDRKRGEEVHPFSQAGDQNPERVTIDIPWKAR